MKNLRPFLLRRLLDVVLVVAVFLGINAWQTRRALDARSPAPAFTLAGLDGAPLALGTPGKRSLVYFFAPWCGVCKVSIGNLAWLRALVGDDLQVTAVALDYEATADVEAFLQGRELAVPVALGDDKVRDAYHVDAFPTYYVLDAEGKVAHVSVGYSSFAGMLWRVLAS